jgi:hypothetical protein
MQRLIHLVLPFGVVIDLHDGGHKAAHAGIDEGIRDSGGDAREPGYEDLGRERDTRGDTTGGSCGKATDGLDGRGVKAHRVHETNLPGLTGDRNRR